jgi:rhamnosyltransferase
MNCDGFDSKSASEENPQSVCAVIVTYNPTREAVVNIRTILPWVQNVIVVDHGSNPEALHLLRTANESHQFELIENPDNLGIAQALNQGVQRAKSHDFPWVILFDQDSRITDGFVRSMFQTLRSHPNIDRVASVHPRYVAPASGDEFHLLRMPDGGPFVSMTSGALMPTWIFDRVGWFASEYFIDCVDWEFCARCRAAGFLVVDSTAATLLHAAGDPTKVKFLGFSFQPSHHSALRRYYIARNSLVFYRKYFFHFPRQILLSAYWQTRGTLKSILLEEDRGRKFLYSLLGTWDGLRSRMGRREGLSG